MRAKLFPVVWLLCLLMVAAMPVCGAAEPELPILSVSGSGTVFGTPDQAEVTIGVVTHAATGGEAQQDNAVVSADVRNALMSLGIAEQDIKTEDYSFRPEYSREKNERNAVTGYTVSNMIRVRVRDVAIAGEVIDAALSNGANTIRSLEFSIGDTDALRKEALENAVKDAKNKADALARALGTRIVGIHHVTENTGMFRPRGNSIMMAAKSADLAEQTAVEAGEISLTADVHIDFILER